MEDERIETKWFTAREIDKLIQSGKIIDAKTMIGFLRWQRYLGRKSKHRLQRLRAMAHQHLVADGRFAEGAAERLVVEQRIVAESAGAARRVQDPAFHRAAKRPRPACRPSPGRWRRRIAPCDSRRRAVVASKQRDCCPHRSPLGPRSAPNTRPARRPARPPPARNRRRTASPSREAAVVLAP